MDWRPLLDGEDDATAATRGTDAETEGKSEASYRRKRRRKPFGERDDDRESAREPLDDDANFVPLTRDEVRAFLEVGMADALTPRFWDARDERSGDASPGEDEGDGEGVDIDDHTVAAIAGRPVFFVGLRKPPKPVAPFGREEPTWLSTCVFLDPTTLQCRIHGSDRYPDECRAYPEHNLALEQATECERVEAAFGGDRLLEADHDDPDGLLLGSQAIGAKLFCHPEPAALEGIIDRAASGDLTRADRAEAIAVAAGSSPGTLAISDHHYERAKAQVLERTDNDGDSTAAEETAWVGPAIRDWTRRYRAAGETVPSPTVADIVETDRGAPETPGWDDLE
ncbi:hypothetical protein C489_15232 [Natrinema versiforme JCM 10478]|uniref:Uncharacterized protein n=2 Tax=Natrinema versiforme TaxID=88724 RepID=L9XTP2_9EURY|nr:hypothetical protein C489_15232 [Natrinema versiforme JCM 10478]